MADAAIIRATMRFANLLVLALLQACREEHLPLAPEPEPKGPPKRAIEKVEISPYIYDHFTRADLVSAANARYGTVELNITAKPEVAEKAAREAETYLKFAYQSAEAAGKKDAAGYMKRAAELLVQAVAEAKEGKPTSADTLAAARRQLDMAIEQVNASLTPNLQEQGS
jgi:hypothetical protein